MSIVSILLRANNKDNSLPAVHQRELMARLWVQQEETKQEQTNEGAPFMVQNQNEAVCPAAFTSVPSGSSFQQTTKVLQKNHYLYTVH